MGVITRRDGTLDELAREEGDGFDSCYWAYNLPLQMWKSDKGGYRVLNYMPRKEICQDLGDPVSPEQLPVFCANAAKTLRNLADLFEALGRGEIGYIYYPDKTVEKARKDFLKEHAEEASDD